MNSNHQIVIWSIFSRRIKHDEARDCPLPPDGTPCKTPSVPPSVPSITEKIDLPSLGFILPVKASTIRSAMVAPNSFDSLHAIKAEKPLIYLTLSMAYPVYMPYACWFYPEQICKADVGFDRFHDRRPLDDEIGGHTAIHRSSLVSIWGKKNDALLLLTTVRVSGQHCLVYLAYAKLFSLNLVLAASWCVPKP
jgi:hypothetical protein